MNMENRRGRKNSIEPIFRKKRLSNFKIRPLVERDVNKVEQINNAHFDSNCSFGIPSEDPQPACQLTKNGGESSGVKKLFELTKKSENQSRPESRTKNQRDLLNQWKGPQPKKFCASAHPTHRSKFDLIIQNQNGKKHELNIPVHSFKKISIARPRSIVGRSNQADNLDDRSESILLYPDQNGTYIFSQPRRRGMTPTATKKPFAIDLSTLNVPPNREAINSYPFVVPKVEHFPALGKRCVNSAVCADQRGLESIPLAEMTLGFYNPFNVLGKSDITRKPIKKRFPRDVFS